MITPGVAPVTTALKNKTEKKSGGAACRQPNLKPHTFLGYRRTI